MGSVATADRAHKVHVCGDHAYVACLSAGLQVIDVSDPSQPYSIGQIDTLANTLDVVVSGDRAYLADGNRGIHVVDVSDPANPSIIGSIDTPGSASVIDLSGDYAFVSGLHIAAVRMSEVDWSRSRGQSTRISDSDELSA